MNLCLAYRGRSTIGPGPTIELAPNLARSPVRFEGTLRHLGPFREAFAAFHEVLIARPPRPGRKPAKVTATLAIRDGINDREFRRQRTRYWAARREHADQASGTDPSQWRLRMPCDPVLTVAADALIFEAFAADESSYACLTVKRDAFSDVGEVTLGSTTVDVSPEFAGRIPLLIGEGARFRVDPSGYEAGRDREETVDVPARWLRSFLRLQSVMGLPMRRDWVGREALYNVLMETGRRVVLRVRAHGGVPTTEITVSDRDRLQAISRLLPKIDGVVVHSMGDGLPSFWSVQMGSIGLTLGLSGWTAKDWMGPSKLDRLAPPVAASRYNVNQVVALFRSNPSRELSEIVDSSGGSEAEALACLHELAGQGRILHDLPAGFSRWREWMPEPMTTEVIGQESPEAVAAKKMAPTSSVKVTRSERPNGTSAIAGSILGMPFSMVIDAEDRIIRYRCACSHHASSGFSKSGPCRHIQAAWLNQTTGPAPSDLTGWLAMVRA